MSRIALVTGANQGLGFALAEGLAQRMSPGDIVYLTGRDLERVRAAASRVDASTAEVRPAVLDVSDSESITALCTPACERGRETQGRRGHCAGFRHRAHDPGTARTVAVGEPSRSGAHALVPNGGGVVIRVRGTVVGALGVSGAASSITDHKVGAAAVAQLS
jgi:NAD(P)-dependent dehydrogenase (short-subunit alcohol dehydrogenase family)